MGNFIFNPDTCMSCKSCLIACAVEHSESKNIFSAVNENPIPVTRLQLKKCGSSVKIEKCYHCISAVCINKCPAGALSYDSRFNHVLIDQIKCKKCGACIKVCPNKAFVKIGNNIHKCDGCIHRIYLGLKPACVFACKTDSLTYSE